MAPSTKKQWSVMVYLAGDNNLDSAGVVDLKEMKKVGSTPEINVVAQFDRQGKEGTKRFFLRKGTTLNKDAVQDLGETNTGDPSVLKGFIQWGIKNYPANQYLLIVWNHGNGWSDDNVYRLARNQMKHRVVRRGETVATPAGASGEPVSMRRIRIISGQNFHRSLFRTPIERAVTQRGIAYDDNAEDFLTNVEMKKVLTSVRKTLNHKIDILGMDACLMSMAEVGYQLRDSVQFTVGSEQTEPGDGWPYDRILKELAARPTMTPQALSSLIVKKYLASYRTADGVTQSACDLNQSAQLATAISELGKELQNNLSDPVIRSAIAQSRIQVQAYEIPDYIDLTDFCILLEQNTSQPGILAACRQVSKAISEEFVVASGYKGGSLQHSHGVSIYFPQTKISPLYATLDFARQTRWDEFLKAYLAATRRHE